MEGSAQISRNESWLLFNYNSRQFAENELWPIAGKIDKTCEYPEEQIHKMGELGKLDFIENLNKT